MVNDIEYKTIENMEKYGGSFVKVLALCFRHADPVNFKKLKTTFSEYWEQYKNFNKKER